jgi:hypothetical protein
VAVPYVPIFLGLLLAYMVYSQWFRLDSRYPIAGALVLLVVTAVVDATGNLATANTLAEFVFFLLAAGVVLLLLDHARTARGSPEPSGSGPGPGEAEPPEAAQERQGTPEQSLDRAEEQTVALVDAPGQQHDQHEQPGDTDREGGETP